MKKIILGIFVFVSFLLNAQKYKIEDNALNRIFEAKGKTKRQSLQQDITALQNRAISPLRLDRYVDVSYDENSIQGKFDVVFDANGNQTLFIDYYWNIDSQSFVPDYKIEYTYDANGNATVKTYYIWDTDTQSFYLNSKIESTYDSNGNETLSSLLIWDFNTQSFSPRSYRQTTYDANGNPTYAYDYGFIGGPLSFRPSGKDEYTYDANGNQTLQINYYWNTTTQSFVLSFKQEYAYDENGNRTLLIFYLWNTTTQSFIPDIKYEYVYDANGNQTLSINYSWNTTTQSFVPNRKIESTYNNGLPITFLMQKTIYKWYSDLGIFKPSFKTEYATILDDETQLHRKGVLYQYDTNFNVWNALLGDEYNSYEYYTKNALSTETIDNNLISIYPNPTSDLLYVSHPELNSLDIQITDLSGRQMYSGAMQKEVPLNVSSYAKGMYLVTVENKETNKKKTYKVVKK